MIHLDRRLTLSLPVLPVSICVFCVFCGSIFLVYCRHYLAKLLTPAEGRERLVAFKATIVDASSKDVEGRRSLPLSVDSVCKRRGEYSSQCRHTAGHEQQDAGDEGRIVGGQEQDRGGDLLGPARALSIVHGGDLSAAAAVEVGVADPRCCEAVDRLDDLAVHFMPPGQAATRRNNHRIEPLAGSEVRGAEPPLFSSSYDCSPVLTAPRRVATDHIEA
jgi:hypothetical protein